MVDRVHPRILKELSEELSTPLSIIFTESLIEGQLSQNWKDGIVPLSHKKKREKELESNYRPISLTCIAYKMMVKKNKKTLWPLFRDGVQLSQGYSHFEEAVYFLPFSSQTK